MEILEVGSRITAELEIGVQYTVPGNADKFKEFGDMPPVFATAMLVAFIEETAIKLLKPYYNGGEKSFGTKIDISHIAATPIALTVKCEIEVSRIMGKTVEFNVRCFDGFDLICEGTHERKIRNELKFMENLNKQVPKA